MRKGPPHATVLLTCLLATACALTFDPSRLDEAGTTDGRTATDAAADAAADARHLADAPMPDGDAGFDGCFWGADPHPGTEPTACGRGGGPCALCRPGSATRACVDGACVVARRPVSLSANINNTCVVDDQGDLWCFGSSDYQALGTRMSGTCLPVLVTPDEHDWASVSVGGIFITLICGTKRDGTGRCWADNSEGGVGNGALGSSVWPPASVMGASSSWTAVSAGDRYAMGIRDGMLYGWGKNAQGQTGHPMDAVHLEPTWVPGETTWRQIAGEFQHSCGILADSRMMCWGTNNEGNTGMATGPSFVYGPTLIDIPLGWSRVATGYKHTCAIRAGGELLCWGRGMEGQLGNGGTVQVNTPTPSGAKTDRWVDITAGWQHTCGIRTDGTLACWGVNDRGQVDPTDSTTPQVETPTPVLPSERFERVVAGSDHTCAVTDAGRIFCWGSNRHFEIGTCSLTMPPFFIEIILPEP